MKNKKTVASFVKAVGLKKAWIGKSCRVSNELLCYYTNGWKRELPDHIKARVIRQMQRLAQQLLDYVNDYNSSSVEGSDEK